MRVELISITKPIKEEIENFTPEEVLAYVARVSNPSNQMNSETSSKLLGYCIKNAHWSVFEHVSLTVSIETSRAIAAQILRHRSFTFQEFSQRYASAVDKEVYSARRQDNKNRQNSIDDMDVDDQEFFRQAQEDVWSVAYGYYQEALSRGIAKEQARFLLPLSTQTKIYMTGNVRGWIHYLDLRCANGTQKEHKDIADAIKQIFIEKFPSISEAKGWVSE
jgi:thymidylate synthase (FAD)